MPQAALELVIIFAALFALALFSDAILIQNTLIVYAYLIRIT
jgi:hypothetical protein